MNRAQLNRFVGSSGNVRIANGTQLGWKIQCKCGAVKTLSSHHDHAMSPQLVVKKMLQSGWHIGGKPGDDICPACLHKPKHHPVMEKVPIAKPDYYGQLQLTISLAQDAIANRQFNQATELLDVALRWIRDQAPPPLPPPAPTPPPPAKSPPPPTPAAAAAPPAATDDYETWLAEQDAKP